jgi:hypothetical protein
MASASVTAWEVRDAIVAKVNGEVLTNAEISSLVYENARLQGLLNEFKSSLSVEEQERLAKEAVHALVRTELIKQEAKRLNQSVTEEQVGRTIKQYRMDDSELNRRIVESNLLFDQILAAEGILIRPASPRVIRTFYQANIKRFQIPRQIILRQVLVPKATAETREIELSRIRRYQRLVKNGLMDFKTLAGKYCSTPIERDAKGLVRLPGTEWDKFFFAPSHPVVKNFFPPKALAALATLEPKKMSGIVESKNGFHLFYIDDERKERNIDFERAQKEIISYLMQRNRTREQRRWLIRIMQKSLITWHDDKPIAVEDIMPTMPQFELRRRADN